MTARRLVPAALAALLLAPAAAAHAAPKEKPCPKGGRTLAVDRDKQGKVAGRLFKRDGVVYGCSTYYPSYGKVTRLGRFSPRLAKLSGTYAIWTIRKHGKDRVTMAEVYGGKRRVKSRKAVPAVDAGGSATGAKVDALRIDGNGIFAWVASTGDLVVGGSDYMGAPVDVKGPGGDEHHAHVDRSLAVVDQVAGAAAARRALVRHLYVTYGDGDGDECGGVDDVTWHWSGDTTAHAMVDWTNPSC